MILIASADEKWGIGREGDLLFSIPEDMRFFRESTTGKTIIMGKTTLLSLPKSAPLPKRRNIVLSRTLGEVEGAEVYATKEEALAAVAGLDEEDVFVIGGAAVYKEFLPQCDTAYITRIYKDGNADKFLPDFDALPDWEKTSESELKNHEGTEFKFITYKRK